MKKLEKSNVWGFLKLIKFFNGVAEMLPFIVT